MNIISVVFIRMFEDKIFCLSGWMFRGVSDKITEIVYKMFLWYNRLVYQSFCITQYKLFKLISSI